MSQELAKFFRALTDEQLRCFERGRDALADLFQSKAAEAQRDADAARKELKRRKRHEANPTGR